MENRVHRKTEDGIDRRGMLKCMAWVGTGLVWTLRGGILSSQVFGREDQPAAATDFSFVQISDSHIGFRREPNKDVVGTLKVALDRINQLPQQPAFLLHTGDLTHLAKPEEFDTVAQVLKGVKAEKVFYVPGEHDFDDEDTSSTWSALAKRPRGPAGIVSTTRVSISSVW